MKNEQRFKDIFFDIEALGGKEVHIPEKEEYPDLFPTEERGTGYRVMPIKEHFKAHLARVSENDFEELENQGLIKITRVDGNKIVDLVQPVASPGF